MMNSSVYVTFAGAIRVASSEPGDGLFGAFRCSGGRRERPDGEILEGDIERSCVRIREYIAHVYMNLQQHALHANALNLEDAGGAHDTPLRCGRGTDHYCRAVDDVPWGKNQTQPEEG